VVRWRTSVFGRVGFARMFLDPIGADVSDRRRGVGWWEALARFPYALFRNILVFVGGLGRGRRSFFLARVASIGERPPGPGKRLVSSRTVFGGLSSLVFVPRRASRHVALRRREIERHHPTKKESCTAVAKNLLPGPRQGRSRRFEHRGAPILSRGAGPPKVRPSLRAARGAGARPGSGCFRRLPGGCRQAHPTEGAFGAVPGEFSSKLCCRAGVWDAMFGKWSFRDRR